MLLEVRQRAKEDFAFYAKHCAKIRTKNGGITNFVLNPAQLIVHDIVEQQKKEKGYVRIISCKARQVGFTTYVGVRGYWKLTHNDGLKACILAHERSSSDNIYTMVKTIHDNCPDSFKTEVGKSNAKEFYFSRRQSGYKVATANNKYAGRSNTFQYLHASEMAFWRNAGELALGMFQTVGKENTEVYIESSANGKGNAFYQHWRLAERGESDFIPIFLPFFLMDEYRMTPPKDFTLTENEERLAKLYDLDEHQLAWRRSKVSEFSAYGDGESFFMQEYPCSAQEAFQTTGRGSYISSMAVAEAMKRKGYPDVNLPLLIGVDPAVSENGDYTAIIRRRGSIFFSAQRFKTGDALSLLGVLTNILQEENPSMMFVDVGGLGTFVGPLLSERFPGKVSSVNFGSRSMWPEKYNRKREEMYAALKDMIEGDVPCCIPDEEYIESEFASVVIDFRYVDMNGALKLKSKELMREEGLPSPDMADAMALTFAFNVPYHEERILQTRNFNIY